LPEDVAFNLKINRALKGSKKISSNAYVTNWIFSCLWLFLHLSKEVIGDAVPIQPEVTANITVRFEYRNSFLEATESWSVLN